MLEYPKTGPDTLLIVNSFGANTKHNELDLSQLNRGRQSYYFNLVRIDKAYKKYIGATYFGKKGGNVDMEKNCVAPENISICGGEM